MSIIGTTLGTYEIGALAGRGGMGEVYRARDSRLKRTVAIKILPPEFARDADRLQRFQQEAEALAALNHPHIAAIHALEEAHGRRFLVLEFVEGETLAERLAGGPLPPDDVASIALQICGALAAAHDRGIVHRDLKPANIKIAPDGQAKLLDFGLAQMFAADGTPSDLSHSPTVAASAGRLIAGTAAYMAPEQARGKAVDKRADIWALGCVLYEMLTGRPLFSGETVTDVLAAVVTQTPNLDELPPAAPAQLRWLIGRCLQRDPAARFRDAADAAAVLSAPGANAIVQQPSSRRRWPAAAAAIAAVVAGAIAFLSPTSRRSPLSVTRFDIPVTNAPLNQSLAVSPDGRRVVYVGEAGASHFALWLRSLDALEAKMIDGTESNRTFMFPAWSPDSRSVVFAADGKLKKVDVIGGGVDTLAPLDSQVGGISWSRDGVIVFATNNHGLRRVQSSGGQVADVSQRDMSLDESYHDCPVFLPDGRHLLYLGYSESKPENRAIYATSLDSNTRTRLMASDSCVAYAKPGFILFPRGHTLSARPFDAEGLRFTGDALPIADEVGTFSNGELAAFAVSDGGTLVYRKSALPEATRSLVWIDRNGRVGNPLGGQIQPATGPIIRLSPDDKRVVYSTPSDGARDDIWTYDLERNVRLRLTTDPDVDHVPAWSPDGSRVVFDSHRGNKGSALYDMPANGAVPERVVLRMDGTDFIAATDWSRDGRFVLFQRSPGGGPPWSLWALPLAPGAKPFLYKQSSADNVGARVSPNGRWVAYSTNESGNYQVVVQTFPDSSGGKWQLSDKGGALPVWRRDGREIYYVAASGDLVAVSLNADSTFTVAKSMTLFRTPTASAVQGSPYDAAADGQRFLFAVPAANTSPPLTTIENWTLSIIRADR